MTGAAQNFLWGFVVFLCVLGTIDRLQRIYLWYLKRKLSKLEKQNQILQQDVDNLRKLRGESHK